MCETAVSINHLSIEYRKTEERIETLKEYVIRLMKRNVKYKSFLALNDISLDVKKGDRIGVIGHNGAGKSTLMKVIAEVLKPTKGSIQINGAVAPMLELGAGFDLDFSGYDNIFLNAAILGRSKEYIEQNLDKIIAFADLGDFIYTPVKNYSSGMRAKLGFSIATQIEPDILIIDEVLGVGDVRFQKKSSAKMRELIEGGTTAIIVSHSIPKIMELTEKTLWLDHGELKMFDDTKKVCKRYMEFMNKGR